MDEVKVLTAEWGEAVYNARENWTVSPHEHIERLIAAGDALIAALAAPRPSGEDADLILRRFLWVNHGCPVSSLYGDDGELQCNATMVHAPIDFKREALPDLVRVVVACLQSAPRPSGEREAPAIVPSRSMAKRLLAQGVPVVAAQDYGSDPLAVDEEAYGIDYGPPVTPPGERPEIEIMAGDVVDYYGHLSFVPHSQAVVNQWNKILAKEPQAVAIYRDPLWRRS